MKVCRQKNSMVWLGLIFMVFILIMTSLACEGAIPIRVVNQTDQTLTIIINKVKIGEVDPGMEIKNQNPLVNTASGTYFIEAKNAQGDTIYSESFTFDQLSRDMRWKVVISPSQNK